MSDKVTAPKWTHVALPVADIERSIEFYAQVTPLVVVSRFADGGNRSAWLSNDQQADSPFVLVLAQFGAELGKRFNFEPGKPIPTLAPFAHIGIELPSREDVDAAAERGKATGCLRSGPQQRDEHVGYICSLFDPDGNIVEFSYDQKVYSHVRQKWGGQTPNTRQAVIDYIEALNAADIERIVGCVTEDFWNEHTAASSQSLRGRDAYRERLKGFLADYRQMHYAIEDLIVEGDRAGLAYRMTYLWHGAEPPRPVTTRGMFRFEVRDGLIARRTDYRDSANSKRQMETLPPQPLEASKA
jgi:catechol 2,3-dioxygenase-like lactoylglutathione lyase family enzyme/ketosteroid isomerase-like protein